MRKRPVMREETLVAATLCIRLPDDGALRPLTQSEFRQTTDSLNKAGYALTDILTLPNPTLASLLQRATLVERVAALRQRYRAIIESLDAWAAKGIWVLGEADDAYPDKLVRRLAGAHPPLLFGCGPNGSLDAGGICIVGSRNSSGEAISFAETLAARCAEEQLTVVSSDMRGVDRAAIQAATENSGRTLMILSDKLIKTIAQTRFARALADQTITMVTPFAPDVGFSVGNAVRANRYQYAMSDLAVIAETRSKGGIWQGAEENRKGGWVPAFVRYSETIPSGNRALLHLGLTPITLDQIKDASSVTRLFLDLRKRGSAPHIAGTERRPSAEIALFRLFQTELEALAQNPVSKDDIIAHFGITSDQAEVWLTKAVESGAVCKTDHPTTRWIAAKR